MIWYIHINSSWPLCNSICCSILQLYIHCSLDYQNSHTLILQLLLIKDGQAVLGNYVRTNWAGYLFCSVRHIYTTVRSRISLSSQFRLKRGVCSSLYFPRHANRKRNNTAEESVFDMQHYVLTYSIYLWQWKRGSFTWNMH